MELMVEGVVAKFVEGGGGVPIIVVLEDVVNIEISSFAVIIRRVKSSASSISFSMSST